MPSYSTNLICPDCASCAILKEIAGNRESPENMYEIWCPVCGKGSGSSFSKEDALKKWLDFFGLQKPELLYQFCVWWK